MATIDSFNSISDGDVVEDGFFNESNYRLGSMALQSFINSERAGNAISLTNTVFSGAYNNIMYSMFASQVGSSALTGFDYTNTTACLGMRNAYFGTVVDDFLSSSTIAASQIWTSSGTVAVTSTDKGYVTITSSGTNSYIRSNGSSGINVKTATGNTELFISMEYYINTASGTGPAYNGSVSVQLTDGTNSVELFGSSLNGASGNVKTRTGFLDLIVNYNKTTNIAYVTQLSNHSSYSDLQGSYITNNPFFFPLTAASIASTSLVTNGYLQVLCAAGASATASAKVYVVGKCDTSAGNVDVVTVDNTLNNASDTALLFVDTRGTLTSAISKNSGGTYTSFVNNSPLTTAPSSTAKLKFTGAKPTTITADGSVPLNATIMRGYGLLYD